MSIAGVFCDENMDADELEGGGVLAIAHQAKRRAMAESFIKNTAKFYRYNIATVINHGLARQEKPLPSSIPIQITFNRAKAAKGLLKIKEKTTAGDANYGDFPDPVISLINPILKCYFVESAKAESFYSKTKLYDVSLPFLDYNVRRELLLDNVKDFNLKLYEGPLPSYIIIGFMSPDAFAGSFDQSSLKFSRHELKNLEIRVDSQPIEGHPLAMHNASTIEFFYDYLRSTNR